MAQQLYGRRVKRLQAHDGVPVNPGPQATVANGVDSTKHGCEMTLTPAGVLVLFKAGDEMLIPNSNLKHLFLEPETKAEAKK